MISLAEINTAVKKFKVSAETIEKDYIISWILLCLAQSNINENFLFYGGTAIKRIYFDEHRFSEDIDLISTNYFSVDSLLAGLTSLEYAREEANIILEVNPLNIVASKDRVQLFISYPGFEEITGAAKEIRLDFSMNVTLFGHSVKKEIIKSYSDINPKHTALTVMTLNTILANKLGMLMDLARNEPRDIYDVYFLLARTLQFDFSFEKVCEIFKKKYGFVLSFKILKNLLQNKSLKTKWSRRLNHQVATLPDFDEIVNDIEKKLKGLFK